MFGWLLFFFQTRNIFIYRTPSGSMLELIMDEDVFHVEDLQNTDPVTFETYAELLFENERPIFCVVVCRGIKHVYFAQSIVKIRYTTSEMINICERRDPLTRNEIEDILYFEVPNNPLFKNNPLVKMNGGVCGFDIRGFIWQTKNVNNILKAGDVTIKALFLCNEFDLLGKIYLQNRIFQNMLEERSFYDVALLGIGFIVHLGLFLFLMIACFYFVLGVVLR